MRLDRTDAFVVSVAAIIVTILSIIVGIYSKDLVAGLICEALGLMIGFWLDIRLHQFPNNDKRTRRIRDSFNKIRGGEPFFKKLADEKVDKLVTDLEELSTGCIKVPSEDMVCGYIRRLTSNGSIKTLMASSYNELDEWRCKASAEHYMLLNRELLSEGKNVERVFILDKNKIVEAADVLNTHYHLGVKVWVCPKTEVINQDLMAAGNSLFFLDNMKKPFYCVNAKHIGAELQEATIYHHSHPEAKRVIDAYKRICLMSKLYDPVSLPLDGLPGRKQATKIPLAQSLNWRSA